MKDPFDKNDVRVTVIGGGTGSFMLLSEMKKYTSQIAAIVNMVDDGGSTGVLRDELGVLPPGDVRQCLVALSESSKVRELFDYRFEEGTFKGHTFGNLLLTAMEKVTGDFIEGIETASEILRVRGMVVPATLDNVRLKMEWAEASLTLHGERVIAEEYFRLDPRRATLRIIPDTATANPTAIKAIEEADLIIVAPGDLYGSIGPLLITNGIGQALKNSNATKVYVCNLVTKHGQTDGFSVVDHVNEIERFAGVNFVDYVFYNTQEPAPEVQDRYKEENAYLTVYDHEQLESMRYKAIGGDFLGQMAERKPSEQLQRRSLIRHDSTKLVKAILEVFHHEREA